MTDRELVIQAIRRAGDQKALAKVFGVAQSAISEWGRTRSIPRHARPRLEDYVKPKRPAATEETTEPAEAPLSAPVRDLVRLLEPDRLSGRLADLPRQYRKRYEERVADVVARVKRELEEYQALLEAEHRTGPRKRKRRSSPESVPEPAFMRLAKTGARSKPAPADGPRRPRE